MTRPIVWLDSDDVLGDFVGAYALTISGVTGRSYVREDLKIWDMQRGFGLSDEEYARAEEVITSPGWCAGIQPLPLAVEGVEEIREFADVYVATACSAAWARERLAWLDELFGIPRERVFLGKPKYLLIGDALVDDKIETLLAWQVEQSRVRAIHRGTAVRFETPWNAAPEWPLASVGGWPQLVALLRGWFL